MNKRVAIEMLYWNGISRDDIYARLVSKFPEITTEYVDEVCFMLEDDDYLNEGNVGA